MQLPGEGMHSAGLESKALRQVLGPNTHPTRCAVHSVSWAGAIGPSVCLLQVHVRLVSSKRYTGMGIAGCQLHSITALQVGEHSYKHLYC